MAIHPTDTGDKLHADNQDVIEDNSAPRERSAEDVAPDTSGVLQPTDTGDRLHADDSPEASLGRVCTRCGCYEAFEGMTEECCWNDRSVSRKKRRCDFEGTSQQSDRAKIAKVG